MDKTKHNTQQPEPMKLETFKAIKEFLEIESNNLDVFVSRAPPQSVDAKLTYLMRSLTVMGTALHAALELLSTRHEPQIQIVPSIKPPGN